MNSNGMIKTLSKEEIGIFSEENSFIYKEAMHTSDEAANMLIQRINKSQALVISFFNEEKMVGFLYGFEFTRSNWWAKQIDSKLPHNYNFYHNSFELNELMVLPSEQGKGIGKKLMNRLHEKTDYNNYMLSTQKDNYHALKLYKNLGYEIIIDDFYFEGGNKPFVVMAKIRENIR